MYISDIKHQGMRSKLRPVFMYEDDTEADI
jgi:hypothetical protein